MLLIKRIELVKPAACGLEHNMHNGDRMNVFGLLSPLSLATIVCSFCLLLLCGCSGSASFGSQQRLGAAMTQEELARYDSETGITRGSKSQFEFLLGELSLKQEKFDEALDHYESAAEAENGPAPALRRRLAQLYLRSGRLDDALTQVDLAAGAGEIVELQQLRAGILATLHRTDEAIAAYRKVLLLTGPQNEEPYIFMASLYAQENRLDDAIKVLNELVKVKPDSFFGHYYLAKVMLSAGRTDESIQFYKATLKLNPKADTVELELARVYAFQKKYDDAITICRKLVAANPANVKARGLLGELLLGRDQVEDALKEFDALKQLETDPSETRFKVALIKLQRRDLEGAETELRLVLAAHPENSAARYYLASAYAGMKRLDEAITQLLEIEKGQEFYREGKMLAAYLLRQRERYKESAEILDQLSSETPGDVKILQLLAAIQKDANQLDKAIKTMTKVVELEPENDQHMFNLGVYYDEAKRSEDAMIAMRRAIDLNPQNSNALNYLGYTMAEKGVDLPEAEALIRRALAIEPNNGYFIDSLGWLYFKMARFEEAVLQLDLAVKYVPDDAVILEHLGRALIEVGDLKRAKEVLAKAKTHSSQSDDKEVGKRIEEAERSLGSDKGE